MPTAWKRTYTEEELSAALRDIQSGKLGTRRAAVIYGIPRSTLRNKVYKLALDRSSNGKRKVNPSPTISSTATAHYKKLSKSSLLNHSNKSKNSALSPIDNSSASASESLKQILKNTITQRANNSNGGDTPEKKSAENLSALAALGMPAVGANSLTDMYNCEALAFLQMLSTIGDTGQPLVPLFTQFLLNLALAKRQEDEQSNAMATPSLPLLPDLIRKLAEQQVVAEHQTSATANINTDTNASTTTTTNTNIATNTTTRNSNSNQSSNSNHSNQSNGDETNGDPQPELSGNSNSNVILKVPSYKPKTSSAAVKQSNEEQPNVTTSDTEAVNLLCTTSSHTESETISDEYESKSFSLKDIIAKSISQRLHNSTTNASKSSHLNSEESSCDASQVDDKYSSDGLKNSGNISDHSNPSTPEKRNRPKRGRYRNYNRDDLAKAVKAVQRGEMSVHRAGQSSLE